MTPKLSAAEAIRLLICAQARLRLGDGREAAYIRVHYFASETRRAVQQALLLGEVDGVDAYVLDLRNNPGAFLGGLSGPECRNNRSTASALTRNNLCVVWGGFRAENFMCFDLAAGTSSAGQLNLGGLQGCCSSV